MSYGQEGVVADSPCAVQPKSQPSRSLRGIVVLVLACVGFGLVVSLFSDIKPERVGELTTIFTIFSVIVLWLWYKRRKFLICCGVLLAVFAIAVSFGAVKVSENRLAAFQTAVQGDFILKDTGDESVFLHPGLGITVQTPGTGFTAMSVTNSDKRHHRWAFINEAQHKLIIISADYCELVTEARLKKALHALLQSFDNSIAKPVNIGLMVKHERVVCDTKERFAEVEGDFGKKSFCMRLIPIEGRYQGYRATVAVIALAADHAMAHNMAHSLCTTDSALAGSTSK